MTIGKFFASAIRLIICTSFFLLFAGCSSNSGSLRMVSTDKRHDFSQSFDQAYISRNDAGDSDVVLVQNGFAQRTDDSKHPMDPDSVFTPRQIVHIRVFWMPIIGATGNRQANTNASLHWYLLGDGSDHMGVLEYAGPGVVMLDHNSSGATVEVRTAWMKAVTQRGNMLDAIGPSVLQGTTHAVYDPDKVKSLLEEMKSAAASSGIDEQAASDVSEIRV